VHAILGPELETLAARGSLRMEIVPGCDHLLTPIASQERALALLRDWAERDLARAR
jgi:hypothetical protein